MSLDITYSSFSPDRADQKWRQQGVDFVRELIQRYTKVSLAWSEERAIEEEVDEMLSGRTATLVQQLKQRFKGTSMDYDWIDVSSAEEFLTEAEAAEYGSILKEKKRLVEGRVQTALAEKASSSEPVLVDKVDLLDELLRCDLEFGSVGTLFMPGSIIVEETKSLVVYLNALYKTFSIDCDSETMSKSDLIQIYSNLDADKIAKASAIFAEDFGCDHERAKSELLQLLKELKPVVDDLMQTADAVLHIDYHGSIDSEPKEVVDLLTKRAESVFEQYQAELATICK